MILTREVDLEVGLKDGRVFEGIATGRVLPKERYFESEVVDLTVQGSIFGASDILSRVEYSESAVEERDRKLIEQRALEALCDVEHWERGSC